MLLIYRTRFRTFLKSGAISVILLQTDGDDSYQKHPKTRYHPQEDQAFPSKTLMYIYVLQAKILQPVNVHDSDIALSQGQVPFEDNTSTKCLPAY